MFGRHDGDPGAGGLFATFVAYAVGSELAFALLTLPPDFEAPDGPQDFSGGFDSGDSDGGL